MGFSSIWHWLIVLLIVLVLFGRGRISEIMGDFGKGVKSFKDGMGDEARTDPPREPARLEGPVHDAPAPDARQSAVAGETVDRSTPPR